MLDKTGTITEGRPVVTDVALFGEVSERELLAVAGSLEKGSEHPLAEAVVKYCEENEITVQPVEQFEAVFGKGVRGKWVEPVFRRKRKDDGRKRDPA